jgi:hypothetical protein
MQFLRADFALLDDHALLSDGAKHCRLLRKCNRGTAAVCPFSCGARRFWHNDLDQWSAPRAAL